MLVGHVIRFLRASNDWRDELKVECTIILYVIHLLYLDAMFLLHRACV